MTDKDLLEAKLLNAAKDGDLEAVKDLLASGVDAQASDNQALTWAAYEGHTEVVSLLLEHGADIKAQDNRAIRAAVGSDHHETIEFLLSRGADQDAALEEALNGLAAESINANERADNEKTAEVVIAKCQSKLLLAIKNYAGERGPSRKALVIMLERELARRKHREIKKIQSAVEELEP